MSKEKAKPSAKDHPNQPHLDEFSRRVKQARAAMFEAQRRATEARNAYNDAQDAADKAKDAYNRAVQLQAIEQATRNKNHRNKK